MMPWTAVQGQRHRLCRRDGRLSVVSWRPTGGVLMLRFTFGEVTWDLSVNSKHGPLPDLQFA